MILSTPRQWAPCSGSLGRACSTCRPFHGPLCYPSTIFLVGCRLCRFTWRDQHIQPFHTRAAHLRQRLLQVLGNTIYHNMLYMTSQQWVCFPRGIHNVLYRFFFCYISSSVTRNVLHNMLYSICYEGPVFPYITCYITSKWLYNLKHNI